MGGGLMPIFQPFNVTARLMARKFGSPRLVIRPSVFLQCDRAFDGAEMQNTTEINRKTGASFNVTARLMARKSTLHTASPRHSHPSM
ncbi:MAG: hypothetical protein M2R45_00427 [Verrucomicrobia subdivision 3 bacterium]|nr:hypothetical protein [Limisphaerales bacterium]MCS1413693.1 hypothetical protein [Limisphaerales bacterium]